MRCRYTDVLFSIFSAIVMASLLINLFSLEEKWLKVFLLGMLFSFTIVVIPYYREQILICCFVFFLHLQKFNKYIIYEQLDRSSAIEGISIYGFDLFFLAILLIWLYRLIINRTVFVFPLHVIIPFIFIILFAFVNIAFVNISIYMKFAVIFELLKCLFVILYIANNIGEKVEFVYLIIGILLLTAIFQSSIGIGQYITKAPLGLAVLGEKSSLTGVQAGISRIGGTIGHANKFAIFLGTLLQINLACFFVEFSKKHKIYLYYCLISFLIIATAFFLSYSRSGWFSFLVGGAINCSWCLARRTKKFFLSIGTVFLVFILFASAVFIVSESVRNRILLDDKGAGEVRKPLAQVAWNVIYDNPILGIGLNQYTTCYPKYDDTSYWVSLEFPEVVHNEFLLIAAELGVPSFFLFIYILLYTFFILYKISKINTDAFLPYVSIGWIGGFISWCIHAQKEYQYSFFSTRFWFNIGLILAINHILQCERKMVVLNG